MTTRDIKIVIVVRDLSTNKVKADIVRMSWRQDVSLEEIMKHVVDAIERIDM